MDNLNELYERGFHTPDVKNVVFRRKPFDLNNEFEDKITKDDIEQFIEKNGANAIKSSSFKPLSKREEHIAKIAFYTENEYEGIPVLDLGQPEMDLLADKYVLEGEHAISAAYFNNESEIKIKIKIKGSKAEAERERIWAPNSDLLFAEELSQKYKDDFRKRDEERLASEREENKTPIDKIKSIFKI